MRVFHDAPVVDNVEVGASDLIADDIQRGRDEGDATYNQVRVSLGERPVTSFAQITSNVQLQQELKQIYGNVNNVELFVGLMAENHLPGSSLGQTEQALLAQQFENLRNGDRFFYENADSPQLVNQLNNTTLAEIIERNTTITNLQPDVFFFTTSIGGRVTAGSGRSVSAVRGVRWISDSTGAIIATTTTAANGTYSFNNTGLGAYTVEEISPNGATAQTTVDITRGEAITVNFSNLLSGIVVTLGDPGSGDGDWPQADAASATALPERGLAGRGCG